MNEARPLKVLQVIDTLGMGGAETWLMEVLRLWSRTGLVHMDFLATSGQRGVFDDEARQLGARIFYLRYSRWNLPQFASGFRHILREGRYAVLHDHQNFTSGWHFLIGGRELPPVRVTHVHNAGYQIRHNYVVTPGRRLTAWIGKFLVARYATCVAGTSRQVMTEYGLDGPGFHHIPHRVVHCGIDTERYTGDLAEAGAAVRAEFGWPPDARVVLVVGRVDQSPEFGHPQNSKNTGFSVLVGIECARRDPRTRMILVGEMTNAVPLLQKRVAAAGLAGRIVFTGIRHDVPALMLGSDALLFPSRGEGLGMVAIEAQAAGLPVIASTSVPAECEVVRGSVRFLDLAPGPGTWADAVGEAFAAGRFDRARGMARVNDSAFSIEHSARSLLRMYAGGGEGA